MTNLKKMILTIAIVLVLTNLISVIDAESISIEVFHDHRGDHEFCEIRWNSDEYTSKVREEFKIIDCENFLNNIQSSRGWTIEIENFIQDFNNFYQCEKSKWENSNDLLNEGNIQRIGQATDKYTLTRFCDANQNPNPQDTTAPVITNIQTNPQMPFINYGDEQKINIYFDSNEYPITINFKLYDENQQVVDSQSISIQSANSQANYLVPAQLIDGEYTLYMIAKDNAGNSKEYFVGKFKVISQNPNPQDTTAPVITNIQTNPQMPFINYGDEQKINIYFDSNEYPITINFKLYDENQQVVDSQSISIQSANSQANYLVPAQLIDGEYTLYMIAKDNAGNSKEYFVGKFKVISQNPNPQDTTAPVITIISPNKIERSSTILFKIKTNEQSKAWFNLDNEEFKMNAIGENTFTYTLKNMKQGKYKINFYAEDLSGNKTNKKLEFEIDFDNDNSHSNSNNFQTLEFNNNAIQTQPTKIISSSPQEQITFNLVAENSKATNYILLSFIFGILILLILILIVYMMKR